MTHSGHGIGQPVRRREDRRFVTGAGTFAADVTLPQQAYAHLLLSPHAHAAIAAIDTSAAEAAPGVLAVLTGEDIKRDELGGIPCTQLAGTGGAVKAADIRQPLLAVDRVRHVGDRVALVVAETLDQAKDAAALIEVSYDPLPAVTDVDAATMPSAPQLWDNVDNNIAFQGAFGDAAAVDAAFKSAHRITKLDTHNTRVSALPLEPRAALAEVRNGRATLYSCGQKPHTVRQVLANFVFHEPEADFHVVCPDVGGGFGLKGTVYPEDGLVVWAARRVGRPVKWVEDRSEALLTDIQARDQHTAGELALDADGRILALRAMTATNLGAYMSISALVSTLRGLFNLSNVYAIPAIHVSAKAVFTNTTTTGPYRGAGVPETVYLMERLMDQAARETSLDPGEIRRRNLISSSALPYATALQYTYDSGDFSRVLERARDAADMNGFAARRAESEARGKLRGIGIGSYIIAITAHSERMDIRVDARGNATVLAGTFSYGQGHETVYAQMVSDWLGLPLDSIRFAQGDTDRVPFGRGSYGSRSMSMGGGALRLAADEVIDKGKRIAAHMMEASVQDIAFEDGTFSVTGTDRSRSFAEVAATSFAPLGLPPSSAIGLDGTGYFDGPFNFPNGCHICEIEIDPDTGKLDILRYLSVDDVGRVINPLLTQGQIRGGIAQGLGQAFMEKISIDPATGQNLSGSLLDYAVPRATDLPVFSGELIEIPTATNPIGVKGAGENGIIPSTPALINAVLDALAPLGVTEFELPATPERVWRAIRNARQSS